MKASVVEYCRFLCFSYSFEGCLQAIYGFERETLECEKVIDERCIFREGTDILKEMDVDTAKFYLDFIILCSYFLILRAGCYFVLRWRVRIK